MEPPGNRDDAQSDEHRDIVARIEARRADPEFQARLRRMIEEEAPVLARLSDD